MRKTIFCSVLVLLASTAVAQSPAPTQDITLTVTVAELQRIGSALGKEPYNDVAPLLLKLQQQITAQQKAAVPPGQTVVGNPPAVLPASPKAPSK